MAKNYPVLKMQNVDFFVAGFSKCGTTTLCSALGQHPDVFIPVEKEPWFFSNPKFEQKMDWYKNMFVNSATHQKLGEGSTSYSSSLVDELTSQRIAQALPEARFIFIARNPIKRIESSFREMHNSAVLFGQNAEFKLSDEFCRSPQVIADSCYRERLNVYQRKFPSTSILVVFFEDFISQPDQVLRQCWQHIGVDAEYQIDNIKHLNEGSTKLKDTRLLRALRIFGPTGRLISKLTPQEQDKVFVRLRLRRLFSEPVHWDAQAKEMFLTKVLPDATQFLTDHGKTDELWSLQEMSNSW